MIKLVFALILASVGAGFAQTSPIINSNRVWQMITNYVSTNVVSGGSTNGQTATQVTNIFNGLAATNPAVAYVRIGGNNTTAQLGREDKPWATLTNAIDALGNGGGTVDVGIGRFLPVSEAFMRAPNLTIRGVAMPQIDGSETIITNGGSVIIGTVPATNHYFQMLNVGVDVGLDVCATYYGGASVDGITLGSVAGQKGVVLQNVRVLGRDRTNQVSHNITFEGNNDITLDNVKGYNGYHGLVLKADGVNASNLEFKGFANAGLVIKSGNNPWQHAKRMNISNARFGSWSTNEATVDTTVGIKIESYAGNKISDINLQNVIIDNTEYGIYLLALNTAAGGSVATNRIEGVNLSGVTVTRARTGAGISQGWVQDINIIGGRYNSTNTPWSVGSFAGHEESQPDRWKFTSTEINGRWNAGLVLHMGNTQRVDLVNVTANSNLYYGVWQNPADTLNNGVFANNVSGQGNGRLSYNPLRQLDYNVVADENQLTNANLRTLAIISSGTGAGLNFNSRTDPSSSFGWYATGVGTNAVVSLNTPTAGDTFSITNKGLNSGGFAFTDAVWAPGFNSTYSGFNARDQTYPTNIVGMYAQTNRLWFSSSLFGGTFAYFGQNGLTNWFNGDVGTDASIWAANSVNGVTLRATGSLTNNGQSYFPNAATNLTPTIYATIGPLGQLLMAPPPSGGSTNFVTIASGSGTFGNVTVTNTLDAGQVTASNLMITFLTVPVGIANSNLTLNFNIASQDIYLTNSTTTFTNIAGLVSTNQANITLRITPEGANRTITWPTLGGSSFGARFYTNANSPIWTTITNPVVVSMSAWGTNVHISMSEWK